MNTPTTTASEWSCLQISGPDSRKFLQGQLSNDVDLIDHKQAGYFALCTPKGRTVSNFLLAPAPGHDEDTLLFLIPSDLAETVVKTLAKYIVFSKAELVQATDYSVRCIAAVDQTILDQHALAMPDKQAWASSVSDTALLIRCAATSARCLLIEAPVSSTPRSDTPILSTNDWNLADIRDGLGFVTRANSDEYVPQMLNMHLCDGISFTKGCYTGQEIVARAQYRGKIKRRLYRLGLATNTCPGAGTEINDAAGKTVGKVITAAVAKRNDDEPQQCELLAVLSLKEEQKLSLNQQPLELLDLPYELDPAPETGSE